MLYIQKDIKFWNTEDILPVSYKTGTTPEEFEEGAYLLLNEEQEQYHNDYPDASPLECWYMALTPEPQPTPEELLWRARDAKRQEIYDKDIHHYYIDKQDAYVSNTLQMKDKCGRQEEVEVGGHLYASNILMVALDEIADYSEQCAKVTDGLLSRIDAAQTAEEVETIVVEGYPEAIHTTTAALQTKADKAIAKSPEAQAVTFARLMVNSVSLTANQALEMQVLFPVWGDKGAEFGKRYPGLRMVCRGSVSGIKPRKPRNTCSTRLSRIMPCKLIGFRPDKWIFTRWLPLSTQGHWRIRSHTYKVWHSRRTSIMSNTA